MASAASSDDKYVFYNFTSFNFPFDDLQVRHRHHVGRRSLALSTFLASNPRAVRYASKCSLTARMERACRCSSSTRRASSSTATIRRCSMATAASTSSRHRTSVRLRLALLEQGVIYASCNMRGGGEYGEKWHEAGTKLKKQNVFDDFIAAAEYLIAQKYTSPNRLAIQGGSNGGLLVGAVSKSASGVVQSSGRTSRRDGYAALPQVSPLVGTGLPITVLAEANEAEFKALYAYSPIHNVKPGTKYPATLITTADHDDRVVPAHNFKYAAVLQAARRRCPILIRVDTQLRRMALAVPPSRSNRREIFMRSCLRAWALNTNRISDLRLVAEVGARTSSKGRLVPALSCLVLILSSPSHQSREEFVGC